MKVIEKSLKNREGKNKKSIASTIIVIGVIFFISMIAIGFGNALIGIFISIIVLVLVSITTYFILRKAGDLPDIFAKG